MPVTIKGNYTRKNITHNSYGEYGSESEVDCKQFRGNYTYYREKSVNAPGERQEADIYSPGQGPGRKGNT